MHFLKETLHYSLRRSRESMLTLRGLSLVSSVADAVKLTSLESLEAAVNSQHGENRLTSINRKALTSQCARLSWLSNFSLPICHHCEPLAILWHSWQGMGTPLKPAQRQPAFKDSHIPRQPDGSQLHIEVTPSFN